MSDRVDLSDPNGDPGRMFSKCVLWFTCIPVTWGIYLKMQIFKTSCPGSS